MLSAAHDRRDHEVPSSNDRVPLRLVRVGNIASESDLHTNSAQTGALVVGDQNDARSRDETPPAIMFVAIVVGLGFWIGLAAMLLG